MARHANPAEGDQPPLSAERPAEQQEGQGPAWKNKRILPVTLYLDATQESNGLGGDRQGGAGKEGWEPEEPASRRAPRATEVPGVYNWSALTFLCCAWLRSLEPRRLSAERPVDQLGGQCPRRRPSRVFEKNVRNDRHRRGAKTPAIASRRPSSGGTEIGTDTRAYGVGQPCGCCQQLCT